VKKTKDLFAGLNFSDQPAGSPLILLFIQPAKQCFLSQNQPVSAEILPAERLRSTRFSCLLSAPCMGHGNPWLNNWLLHSTLCKYITFWTENKTAPLSLQPQIIALKKHEKHKNHRLNPHWQKLALKTHHAPRFPQIRQLLLLPNTLQYLHLQCLLTRQD
jgi:hypothetical protein